MSKSSSSGGLLCVFFLFSLRDQVLVAIRLSSSFPSLWRIVVSYPSCSTLSVSCLTFCNRMCTFPVRVVFCHRSTTTNEEESMSSRSLLTAVSAGGGDEEDVEEVSEPGTGRSAGASASVVSPNASVVELKSAWEFEKIEKRGGPDKKTRAWFCGWCGVTKMGWNATKVMHHCAKAAGNDVEVCSGNIPKKTLTAFQLYRYKKMGAAGVKRQHSEAFADSVSENQHDVAVMIGDGTIRGSRGKSANTTTVDLTGGGVVAVSASNSTRLTAAIAEFIYCKGLSFSTAEGEHFLQILKLARLVPKSYHPPPRKLLSNELLELSYQNRIERYMKDLLVDADVYGLSLFGDGATVHGMPLMNILAAGVGEPCAVLAIIDCKFLCGVLLFLLLSHH
jgi:hypothetical protein